jgi:hypothetical protein
MTMMPLNSINSTGKVGESHLLLALSSALILYKSTSSGAIEHLKMHWKAWENYLYK